MCSLQEAVLQRSFRYVYHYHLCFSMSVEESCDKCVLGQLCSRCDSLIARYNRDPALIRRAAEDLNRYEQGKHPTPSPTPES